MNIRTLNKENSIHVLILSSFVLSWGVTSYYFDTLASNPNTENLANILLFPLKITENIFYLFNHLTISGNPLQVFFTLWIFYTVTLVRFYPMLMVKDHPSSDLKKWYESRFQISK